VVSLPVLAYACGSDGAISAMRVLIYPTGGLPRVPLQVCLSGADPLLTATTVTVRSINMFDPFLSWSLQSGGVSSQTFKSGCM